MTRHLKIAPIMAIAMIFALSACETMKGAGRDVQKAGAVVTTEAAETQQQM